MDSPIVNITEGKLQGNKKDDINGNPFYSFLAIPYGKPPIGNLRFKAPVPVEPWSGIKDATKIGEGCYQRAEYLLELEGSEDCLNLNVYTKTLPIEEEKLKPVMVWIHGGAFQYGYNKPTLYGPEYLITEDVVIVTINYRLGFLGFLHFKDPSLDVPGNAGLKDQQLALKWVQRNIKQFNGDPNNVTIFGASAGSASVHYHILSPSSKGLFHKAIMQSGCVLNPWCYIGDFSLQFVKSIDKNITNEQDGLKLLQSLSVEQLYKYQEEFSETTQLWGVFGGVVEYSNSTALLTKKPSDILKSGNYNKVPIMLGYTDREGLLFEAIKNVRKRLGKKVEENFDLNLLMPPSMGLENDDPIRREIIKKYMEFYFQSENATDKFMLLTDFFFIIGIIESAVLHSKTSPVFLYRMTLDAGLNVFKKLTNVEESGASHADDIGYLWHVPLAADVIHKGPIEDKSVNDFVKLWTNFAKTGNPTPEKNELNITWKPFTEKDPNILDIGKELTLQNIENFSESKRVHFWKDIYNRAF